MKLYALDRKIPLKLFDDFSVLDGRSPLGDTLTCACAKDEYFVLQLLLVSEEETEEVSITASPLICGAQQAEHAVTCINTQGVDKWGVPFEKKLFISKKEIQPVYLGFQLEGCAGPAAEAELVIQGNEERRLRVTLQMKEGKAVNNGLDDLWRLSRLQWLNSSLYQDNNAVSPYTPVRFEENTLHFLGRTVALQKSGLPKSAASYFDESILLREEPQAELLEKPMVFDVGEPVEYSGVAVTPMGANAQLSSHGESEHLSIDVQAIARYEGSFTYQIKLCAKEDCTLPDVRLTAYFTQKASAYNNGLGKWGGTYQDIDYTWNNMHQDCLFTGGVNCGMRIKWKAERYLRPLVNIYYAAQERVVPVETWANHGKGTIVSKKENGAVVSAQTREFRMSKGETRVFLFELHVTPFRPIDYKKHFATRYCHNNHLKSWEKELKAAKKNHLTHIVIHHGNELHPFINYPFIEVEEMKKFVTAAHKEGIGVKFYYTSREHSNHMAEVFPYKALGDEIILRKKGEGYSWQEGVSPWLTKYFGETIIPAWRVLYQKGKHKGDHDISFIVRPDSRLDNYYIEGLKWLVEQVGIDGIYIDDTALDRQTMERARKVLDTRQGLIDMHMWNHEEERAGLTSCVNLYTEIFPFLDSLWIGEGFPANRLAPDYILTEMSGFPYGQTSGMLDGADQHVGMLYAMNSRYGWSRWDAPNLYRLWDDFGIEQAEMRGYWHSKAPVKTGEADVLATTYLRDGKALVAVYNFAKQKKRFSLSVCCELLGFVPDPAAVAPYVKGLQRKRGVQLCSPLTLKGRSGMIIELQK